MGAYIRKLKRGEFWFYSGMYLGVLYHSKAIYHTKKEALQAERKRRDEIDFKARFPNKMFLKDLIEKRLAHIEQTKSKDYYKENKRYFDKALEAFGNIEVDNITKQMMNELVASEGKRLKGNGKSNFKVNSMIRSLKALFNWGNKVYDLEMKNPCNSVDFYPIDVNLKYIPTDAQILAVKAICTLEQKALIDFVDETGCRILEAVRFKHEDIDGDIITLYTRKSKNSNLTPRRIPKPSCLNGNTGRGKVFVDWVAYPRFLEDRIRHLKQPKHTTTNNPNHTSHQ